MKSILIVCVLAVLAAGPLAAQTAGDLGLRSAAAIAAYKHLVAVRAELRAQSVAERSERDSGLSTRLTSAQRAVLDRALERRTIVRQIRRDQLEPGQTVALRAVGGESQAQRNDVAATLTDRDLLDTLTRRVGLTVDGAHQVMAVLDGFESGERARIRGWRSEKARVLEAIANGGWVAGGAYGSDASAATAQEIAILAESVKLGG